jgi:hypothetical protein
MATTTNYGWTTPDDTALVKDGAAAIRTLGTSIDTTTKALNPSTTLGDIEYRSSTANTNTRLGIGSTGNVLTVAGGVPTWAAPAGGGGKSFSLLSTTSLSGSTTTITGISSIESLVILVDGGSSNSAAASFTCRFNSDSSAVYNHAGILFQMNGSYDPQVGFSDSAIGTTSFPIGKMSSTQTSVVRSSITVEGAKGTGFKSVAVNGGGSVGGGDSQQLRIYQGTYDGTSAISSVSIITSVGTFDSGTVYIYGSA